MTNVPDDSKNARIRYDEGCLAAHALNVIGDRWALLVVRELMFLEKRFLAVRAGLPGISAAVLSQRLTQLIDAGVVSHDSYLGTYGLTQSGRDLFPVLQAIGRWGAHHPGHDHRRFISPTALMISMTTLINKPAAEGRHFVAGFQSGMEKFSMTLRGDGVARVESQRQIEANFTIEGSGNNLASAVYGPYPLSKLSEESKIEVTGNIEAAQRFVGLFSLPRSRPAQ